MRTDKSQWDNGRARHHAARCEESAMPPILFVVKATVPKDREDAFNRWYSEEHCPDVLRYRGAVSARRYRAIMGEDRFQYIAVYEIQDEPTFWRFMESDHMKTLRAEYDAHFPDSDRARFAYVQVWP
jgi:hypothetical protein